MSIEYNENARRLADLFSDLDEIEPKIADREWDTTRK